MSNIEKLTYILPSCFAPALVNSDHSGLAEEDEQELAKWLEEEQPGICVGCSEHEYFKWGHDMNPSQGATVLEFYFHKVN